jgi:hypothetical protein
MKTCSNCSTEKPFSDFHKNKSRKDGLNGFCKNCMKEKCSASYQKNKKKYLENGKKWRAENRDRHIFLSKRWNANNDDRCKENARKWCEENIDKRRAITANRSASKRNATPKWLTKEQKQQIQNFYWLARDLELISGEEYHVDHIIPLSGQNVCGLHVPWNLQVLPKDLNLKKGISYEP